MRTMLALGVLAALLFLSARPAVAVDYQGKMLDGHAFGAVAYGPQGAEPAVVVFNRDEARVQLLDGESMFVQLYNRSIDDVHFVTGKTLDGRFVRLDLNESAWFYGHGNDSFFMPFAPNAGPPIFMKHGGGGGKHSGG